MKRKIPTFSITVNITILLLCFTHIPSQASVSNSPKKSNPRPNIIFLLTDDMRWDAMSCMGNQVIQTPHLDR
ncbi:MAG: hypothetical protein JSV03_02860, partial [Planctomycetota bacterium]